MSPAGGEILRRAPLAQDDMSERITDFARNDNEKVKETGGNAGLSLH